MNVQELAEKHKIFQTLTGSHVYGTSLPTSDTDYRGLFSIPRHLLLDPFFSCEEVEVKGQDSKIYELQNFFRLLVDNNPNILELLWIPEKFWTFKHPVMDLLIQNRQKFLSSKCKHTFSGYARQQWHRIKGHLKWISNPQPEQPPSLHKFVRFIDSAGFTHSPGDKPLSFYAGLSATKINEITYCLWDDPSGRLKRGFLTSDSQTAPSFIDIDGKKLEEINPVFVGNALIAIDEYKEQLKKHSQYWEWRRNRNKARSELEGKHGYDTKHALHLVRLYRMGLEILQHGEVRVVRPDAQELLGIRNGDWSYDQLIAYGEQMDQELERLYQTSSLPHSVDRNMAATLYLEMLEALGW